MITASLASPTKAEAIAVTASSTSSGERNWRPSTGQRARPVRPHGVRANSLQPAGGLIRWQSPGVRRQPVQHVAGRQRRGSRSDQRRRTGCP